jgi:RNA polymerase sigma factor (sigma-70 family)
MSQQSDRQAAFERLFAAHYRAVRAYVLRRSGPDPVDDVVAETFLIAWRRLDSLGEDPLPWLFGVARRVLANHLRADRRRGALTTRLRALGGEPDPGWEPPALMSPDLAAAIASLSPGEREALLLVAWEGLASDRAAHAAGCSPAAFRVRLHRARRRVAGQLADPSAAHRRSPITGEAP